MEILDRVHLLADAEQLDRLAGDRAHRERRAAAPVAVHAGQHDAGEADPLVEVLGEIDRVLAGQRVGDQEDLVRPDGVADVRHLLHQRLVDMGAPGGVEQHDVVALEARGGFGASGDVDRVLARNDRQRVDADLLTEHRELLLRGRALDVERGHQHFSPVAFGEALGDLGGGGGLARALQADQHDRDRGRRVEVDRLGFAAERLDERVVDDLDDHLPGLDRLDDGGADRLGAGAVDEGAHDLERDVRLEERAPHFAHRGVDVLFREGAAAGQLVQYAGELFGQALEHETLLLDDWRAANGECGIIRRAYLFAIRHIATRSKPTPIAPGGATRCRAGTADLKGSDGLIDEAGA